MKLPLFAKYLIILFLGLWAYSCNEDLVIETPGFSQKVVVEAYLCKQYQDVVVKLSKTVTPYTRFYYDDVSTRVLGAESKLILGGTEYQFQEDSIKHFTDYYGYLYTDYSGLGRYYIKNIDLAGASKCSLSINYLGSKIEAEENFPNEVKIYSVEDTIISRIPPGNKYPVRYLSLKIRADFPKNEKSYYRVSRVLEYMVPYSKNIGSLSESDYFCHNSNDNFHLFEMRLIYENMGYEINRVILYLDHITKNHYDFIKAMKTQEENDDTAFGSEGTQIPTNIKNGFGIFTCFTRDSVCLYEK